MVEVRWQLNKNDGTPEEGYVLFTPRAEVSNGTTSHTRATIRADLDNTGAMSVDLLAWDTPGNSTDEKWTYLVQPKLTSGRRGQPFDIDVPHSAEASGIDLADIAPATASSGDPTAFVTLTTFQDLASTSVTADTLPEIADPLYSSKSSTAVNLIEQGAVADGIINDSPAIREAINNSPWPTPNRIHFPAGDYRITETIRLQMSGRATGVNWQASRLKPDEGLDEPVFDLDEEGGRSVSHLAISGGGSAGVAAIRMGGQQQVIEGLDIRSWLGDGVAVEVQNFSTVRNVNVSSCGGYGFKVATTYTLLEGCTSNNNTGNGFELSNSDFFNAAGTLVGCVSEHNGGHGFYITGGEWDLSVYGEANGGDLIHVDGTQQFVTEVTLTAAATAGDTSLSVGALAKPVPEKGILRFEDGTAVVVGADGSGPTITLKSAIATDQAAGATATLAPEDIHPAKLPTVRIRPGTHDGNIYLHACNYAFETVAMPVGGTITATPSARMIGDAGSVLTHKGNNRTWGGGGSYALAAVLGWTNPVLPVGLAHVANPVYDYLLQHSDTNVYHQDADVPGGFYLTLTAQWQWAQTALGWKATSLSDGEYTIRALVREPTNTTNALAFAIEGGPRVNMTTRTTDWEWLELDFTQTATTRSAITGSILVQVQVADVDVDVAAIVIVPTPRHTKVWVGDTARLLSGTGSPESVVDAAGGSLYLRTDGSTGTTLYVKETASGATGWHAVPTTA